MKLKKKNVCGYEDLSNSYVKHLLCLSGPTIHKIFTYLLHLTHFTKGPVHLLMSFTSIKIFYDLSLETRKPVGYLFTLYVKLMVILAFSGDRTFALPPTDNLIFALTRGLCRTELLEVTVCSPSCIMAISPLSSEPSARLLTELLWELALIDMDGREWELSMLLTVPVRSIYCSTS